MRISNAFAAAGFGALLLAAACGDSAPPAATGGEASSSRSANVQLTGNVVEVDMISGNGELFGPDEITVRRGDVVRFKLVAGVHNASFPAADNPRGVKLPAATPYLQAPGQTHDLPVDLPNGTYQFQCDPHAALGMIATMHVVD